MTFSFTTLVKYYGPLLMGSLFLCLLLLTNQQGNVTQISISLFNLDVFQIQTPIANSTLWRFIFVAFAVISIAQYLTIDFSQFFPEILRMEVFFDDEGIRKTLKVFTQKERKTLGICENFEEYSAMYRELLDERIREVVDMDALFTAKEGELHSIGRTTFLVEKLPHRIHQYHIYESNGRLTHRLERPGKPPVRAQTFFDKVESRNDYIESPLQAIFLKGHIIMKPEFKQAVAE